MLDQLREGDVVVVARLDRLARSTRDLLEIAEILKEGGTGLRSLGEPWADTTSPAGKMVLTVAGLRLAIHKVSTALSQEHAVGVTWKINRGVTGEPLGACQHR